MKNLVEYLHENIKSAETVVEAKEKEIRFTPGDLENASETIDSLKSLADKAGIYTEKVDGGIKFKGTPNNKEKFSSIQDVMQQYVDGLQNNEKVDQSKVEALASQVNKLNDWLDDDEEEVKEEPKKDDKENGEDE